VNINFEQVERDLQAKTQTTRTRRTPRTPGSASQSGKPVRGRPPKNIPAGRHYTRIGFDPDVWYAMRNHKVQTAISFQDQVNQALRKYLSVDQQES
jgi:uncharacterized protein (DUF4415 family)